MKFLGYCQKPRCIVTKLYERDLLSLVNSETENQLLVPSVTFLICHQVVSALSAMHRLGFVHRDIKSANILLENIHETAEHVHAVLCDFGLAKNTESVVGQVSSNANLFGFSPRYAAPEVPVHLSFVDLIVVCCCLV